MSTLNTTVNYLDLLNSKSLKAIFNFELFKVRPQDKEDVKQDCIVQILKALKNQEVPTEKLSSFCQTIIKRTVVDYYRYTNRMIDKNSTSVFFSDGFDDSEASEEGTQAFTSSVDEYGYEVSDVRADFERNLYMFTPTERKAIEFMLSNGNRIAMSLTEIAEELKINKSHTTKAFKKLRKIYGA